MKDFSSYSTLLSEPKKDEIENSQYIEVIESLNDVLNQNNTQIKLLENDK